MKTDRTTSKLPMMVMPIHTAVRRTKRTASLTCMSASDKDVLSEVVTLSYTRLVTITIIVSPGLLSFDIMIDGDVLPVPRVTRCQCRVIPTRRQDHCAISPLAHDDVQTTRSLPYSDCCCTMLAD